MDPRILGLKGQGLLIRFLHYHTLKRCYSDPNLRRLTAVLDSPTVYEPKFNSYVSL